MATKSNSQRTKNNRNKQNSKGFKPTREQPKKDSKAKRVNFDNAREDRVAKQIEEDSKKYDANDISDFSRNPELLKAAGTVPFAAILGSKSGFELEFVPGIMAAYWTPSIGGGNTPFAVNQASTSMYSYIVHANSRNYKATAPDYLLINLAGAQLFSLIASGMRAYGFLKYYTERNLYYPDTVIQAMGFDPNDWRLHLADEWFGLNDLIARMQQIWIPKQIPILKRWFDKNSHVYLDAQGLNTQTYMYVQSRYYQYDEVGVDTGGSLKNAKFIPSKDRNVHDPCFGFKTTISSLDTPLESNEIAEWIKGQEADFFLGPDTLIKWDEFLSAANNMLSALLDSEDRGIMYGNMLQAYGAENMYSISPMASDFVLAPEYNAEILTQFENLEVLPNMFPQRFVQREEQVGTIWRGSLSVGVGNTGSVNEYPIAANFPASQHLINFHFPGQPSPEAIMIATRSKACAPIKTIRWELTTSGSAATSFTLSESKSPAWIPSSTSCEVVNGVYIFQEPYSAVASPLQNFRPLQQYIMRSTKGTVGPGYLVDGFLTMQGQLMAFDWHPFIIEQTRNWSASIPNAGGKADCRIYAAFGDYDNYTIISDEELEKLNDVALYSVWGLPHLGR